MKPPALFLFLLVVQAILIPGIDCSSMPTSSTHVVLGRGVQVMNMTAGLHGQRNAKEPGGMFVALSRKGGVSGGESGRGRGSGKGAPGSGGTDISRKPPRTKASATPSTTSNPLFLLILGLACGTLL